MTRARFILPLLLGATLSAQSPSVSDTSLYLVNPSASAKTVHGLDPSILPRLPDGIRQITAADGTVFIMQPLAPMTTARLTTETQTPSAPLAPSPPSAPEFRNGVLRLGEAHLSLGGDWSRHEASAGVSRFKTEDGASELLIFPNGWIRVAGVEAVNSSSAELAQVRRKTYAMLRAPDETPLESPHDWIRIRTASENEWAVVAEVSGRLKASPTGWTSSDGSAFWVLPAKDEASLRQVVTTVVPSLLLRALDRGPNWEGTYRAADRLVHVRVTDRNDDERPDTSGDLWRLAPEGSDTYMLLAFSKVDGAPRMALFEGLSGPLSNHLLDESGGARGDRFAKALESIGAATGDDAPAKAGEARKPAFILEDWNRDGIYLEGSLFEGGYLGADRAGKRLGDWSTAWDLDGDRLGDVFEYNPALLFNFKNRFASVLELHVDPRRARASLELRKGYDMQNYASHFSKTPSSSQFVGQARAGFEEHFFIDLPPDPDDPTFPNGANFFYYTIGGGDVNRLTMGRLSGHGGLRAWEVELDPVPADPAEVNFEVVRWSDAYGHDLHMNSPSIPERWDGSNLGPRGYLAGWYAMAEGEYETERLYATFSPPGVQMEASEGMYGGAYTTQERIEADLDGGSYAVYYSPLMGDLHLKGAEFGSYAVPAGTPDFWLDINRYYHREAHTGPERFVGVEPGIRFREREAKRMEGPVFLSYSDRSGDGYMDQYLYDQDNDGLYDRALDHDETSGLLRLRDRDYLTVWPETIQVDEVAYLPENYEAMRAIYQKGFTQPPMVVRSSIGSSGIPMTLETEPFYRERTANVFLSLPRRWQVRVATDLEHLFDPSGGWTDFGPGGLSRLGTLFVQTGLTQTSIRSSWTSGALESADVLVLNRLDYTPSAEAIESLKSWLREGGRLFLAPETDVHQRLRFAALGRALDFDFGESELDRTAVEAQWVSLGPINQPDSRAALRKTPGPWNAIKHFKSPEEPALLRGMEALSFTGFPLELSDAWRVLLEYSETGEALPLIAERDFGKGRILLSGADWLSNRYIWHHESFERGTGNERLVARLVERTVAGLPVPEIEALRYDAEKLEFTVSGKGGPLRFPRRYQARATDLAHIGNDVDLPPVRSLSHAEIDGQEVSVAELGVLREIVLPKGRHTVTIHYPVEQ